MYKIAVYNGDSGLAGYVVNPGTDEVLLFPNRVEASLYAQKIRKESSLSVWFKIVGENE